MKSYDMTKYRARSKRYADNRREVSATKTNAQFPVEVWSGMYVPVDDIKESEVIEIPERMRDFAVRTVIDGYKPDWKWAEIFGVGHTAIGRWRRDERVIRIRAYMLHDRRGYRLALDANMTRLFYERLVDILNIPLTATNAPTVLAALKFVQDMRTGESGNNHPKQLSDFSYGTNEGDPNEPSAYGGEHDVTPQHIEALKQEAALEKDVTEHIVAMEKFYAMDVEVER